MKKAALAAAFCSVLALSACGDLLPGSKDPIVIGSPGATSATGATTAPDAAATVPAETVPAVTQPPAGPTAPPGKVFTDPKGIFTMTLNKRWVPYKETSKTPLKGPIWYIDAPDGDYRPLVNVVTEPLTGPAEGISLETYQRLSAANLEKGGFKIVKQGSVRGVNSDQLAAIEYTKGPLRFLVIMDVSRTNAAVVTMTSTPRTFKQERAAAQPYMVTIKAAE